MPPRGWRKAKKMPDIPPEPAVSIVFKRHMGKTTLVIRNKGLLDYLKALGAMTNAGKLVYDPGWGMVDTYSDTIQPGALVKYTVAGEHSVDVTSYYHKPVTTEQMQKLGKSLQKAVDNLLEHFTPVEVSAGVTLKAP